MSCIWKLKRQKGFRVTCFLLNKRQKNQGSGEHHYTLPLRVRAGLGGGEGWRERSIRAYGVVLSAFPLVLLQRDGVKSRKNPRLPGASFSTIATATPQPRLLQELGVAGEAGVKGRLRFVRVSSFRWSWPLRSCIVERRSINIWSWNTNTQCEYSVCVCVCAYLMRAELRTVPQRCVCVCVYIITCLISVESAVLRDMRSFSPSV